MDNLASNNWNIFASTGKIDDYLAFKRQEIASLRTDLKSNSGAAVTSGFTLDMMRSNPALLNETFGPGINGKYSNYEGPVGEGEGFF